MSLPGPVRVITVEPLSVPEPVEAPAPTPSEPVEVPA